MRLPARPLPAVAAAGLALAAALLTAAGCTQSRTIIPYADASGKPIPFVYRHDMRAKDAESRASIPGAIVGVKSSDDQVWQLEFTGESGGARLSQEYSEVTVYNDTRTLFFVETENVIRLRAPAFEMVTVHPMYEKKRDGYGANAYIDTPRKAEGFHCAELVRPRLEPLDRLEGVPAGVSPTARPPTLRAIAAALPAIELEGKREGAATAGFSVGPAVHGGRFTRTSPFTGAPERAAKVYFRPDDGAYVLVAPFKTAVAGHAAGEGGVQVARLAALCDTADMVIHAVGPLPIAEPLSTRWVPADREPPTAPENRLGVALAALDAGLEAGARRVAAFYPLELADRFDRALKDRRFELFAEWWSTFD